MKSNSVGEEGKPADQIEKNKKMANFQLSEAGVTWTVLDNDDGVPTADFVMIKKELVVEKKLNYTPNEVADSVRTAITIKNEVVDNCIVTKREVADDLQSVTTDVCLGLPTSPECLNKINAVVDLSEDCATEDFGKKLGKKSNLEEFVSAEEALANSESSGEVVPLKRKVLLKSNNSDAHAECLDKPQDSNEKASTATPGKPSESEKQGDSLILTADERDLEDATLLVPKDDILRDEVQMMNWGKSKPPAGSSTKTNLGINKLQGALLRDKNENTIATANGHNEEQGSSDTSKPVDESNATLQAIVNSDRDIAKNSCGKSARTLWVMNISQSTKATNLKRHLSTQGRVTTAKIVSDGNNCFGYVIMNTSKDVATCMKKLNGSTFDNKKISLSVTRPGKQCSADASSKEVSGEKQEAGKATLEQSWVKTSKNDNARDKSSKAKRRRSKTPQDKTAKMVNLCNPLTTRYARSRRSSKSVDFDIQKDYLREKRENERLRSRLLEYERRSREDEAKIRQREDRLRDREIQLDQDLEKLDLERVMFNKKRKEMFRVDEEKRKLERERFDLIRQKTKFADDMHKTKIETAKKRRALDDDLDNYSRFKNKFDGKYSGKLKKDNRKVVLKRSNKTSPPPKLKDDFHEVTRMNDWERKQYSERKPEPAARNIETITRKSFPPDNYKHKEEKNLMYVGDRKHEYEKRYRDGKECYIERDASARNQWTPSVGYSNSWNPGMQSLGYPPDGARYGVTSFPSPSTFGVPPRMAFYSNSRPDYPRHDSSGPQGMKKY